MVKAEARTCAGVANVLMFAISVLAMGVAGCWSGPDVTILPEIYEGGQTFPMAVSGDGKVVVGLCQQAGLPANGYCQAFRWTEEGGIQALGFVDVEGYDHVSQAWATNCDGSVIVGTAVNMTTEKSLAWVWTAADGMQPIEVPDDVLETDAVDVSDDGVMLGLFAYMDGETETISPFFWSADAGFVEMTGWQYDPEATLTMPAMAISGDGYSVVFDRYDSDEGDTVPDGAWIATFGGAMGGDPWGQFCVVSEQDPSFSPALRACSDNAAMLGGTSSFDGNWATPAIWSAGTGVLQVMPGVVGHVASVSSDGVYAGGGNNDSGTGFIWSADLGLVDLCIYLTQLDGEYGSDSMAAFEDAGWPSNVYGFSEDNRRIVGTAGTTIFGNPCRGFVLDMPWDWEGEIWGY